MNVHDSIRTTSETSLFVLKKYLEDLSDADLMSRPGVGCNHLAWQLGHLISSECGLLESICPGTAAKLPEGFAEQHNKECTNCDDPTKFYTKQQYLDLLDQTHAATMAALNKSTAEDLDKPAPEHLRQFFPNAGSIFILIGTHPLMHAGQFVPVRRKLGKPVVV